MLSMNSLSAVRKQTKILKMRFQLAAQQRATRSMRCPSEQVKEQTIHSMKLQLGAQEVITPLMSSLLEEAGVKILLELKCPWVAEEERTRSVMRCP